MKRGFLLGKFLPPHAGHVFMCRVAQTLCDQLTILVCSLPDDLIPGDVRHGWMTALFPNCRVLHHDQSVPQEPSDHPDFWTIWRTLCKVAHPEPIDTVFGSETYVLRLASELQAEPMLIDRDRIGLPISGTQIRDAPSRHWPMIPGPVRSWFQKRIVLFGGESTGKSTLAAALAKDFGTLVVPEYGRTHDEVRGGSEWTSHDFNLIRERQRAMRVAAAWEAGPLLIEDTDPYLTDVWQAMLLDRPLKINQGIEAADLYLFLAPDLPWIDDGTRYWHKEQFRQRFDRLCGELLAKVGANHERIFGNGPQRLVHCHKAIERHFPDAAILVF